MTNLKFKDRSGLKNDKKDLKKDAALSFYTGIHLVFKSILARSKKY